MPPALTLPPAHPSSPGVDRPLLDSLDRIACCESLRTFCEEASALVDAQFPGGQSGTLLTELRDFRGEVFVQGEGWHGRDSVMMDRIRRHQSDHPFPKVFLGQKRSMTLVLSRMVNLRVFKRSSLYRDIFKPWGAVDSLGIYLPLRSGELALVMNYSPAPYSEETVETARKLQRILAAQVLRFGSVASHPPPRAEELLSKLTPRERDVLHWVAAGKRNAEIATILGLSPLTVRRHLENIFAKLGVETRMEAAQCWSSSGL